MPARQEGARQEVVSASGRPRHWSLLVTSLTSLVAGSRRDPGPYTSETRLEIGIEFAFVTILLAAAVSVVVPCCRSSADQPSAAEGTTQGGAAPQRSEHMLLSMALFLVIGAMFLCWYVEEWTLLETCYFLAQIVTTIGFGDITPKSPVMRLWTTFLILACLIVLARALSEWTSRINVMEEKALSKFIVGMSGEGAGSGDRSPEPRKTQNRVLIATTSLPFACFVLTGTVFYGLQQHCSCSYGATAVPGCKDTDYHTCAAAGGHVMTWLDAFYFSIVSLTTVGFGDFAMRNWWGRLFGIPWMIFGVASTANFVSGMSALLTTTMRSKQRNQAVDSFLEYLDKDEDNATLSKAEHHLYMLMRHGVLSPDTLGKLEEHFQAHDPDGTGMVDLKQMRAASDPKRMLLGLPGSSARTFMRAQTRL